MRGHSLKLCQGGLGWALGRISSLTLEWADREGVGVTDPGGVQGKTGRRTRCHGPADKALFGHRLESLISKVFSCTVIAVFLFIGLAGRRCRAPGKRPLSRPAERARSQPALKAAAGPAGAP